MPTGKSTRAALLLALILALLAPATASADRNFSARFSANDTGDIAFAGNTLMTCPDSAPTCAAARAGTATPISNLQNNSYAMTYVDVDGVATTFNSSRAQLDLPAGATVLFAGLYWGGDTSGSGSNAAPNAADRNKVVLKAPGDSAYRNITATTLDDSSTRYQGFADVTSIVSASGEGNFTVGNVQAAKGSDRYATWTLVVAYRDTTQPARNLTVFDGLKTINTTGGQTIPVSGFRTPPAGAVKTTLGFVTYEGDLGIEGDSANLNGTPLTDSQNPQTNFFNSSISNKGSRVTTKDPDYPNQLGIDSDLFSADGILPNNATSANIGVTTSGDVYLPGVLTFATELYAPRIEQTKSVSDLNGGSVEEGDVLQYSISGTNTGQDGAVGFTVRDPIPANTTYVPGSIQVVSGAGAATGTRTDAAGDDNGEYDSANSRVVARLGTGANASSGGRIAVGANYEVRFRVTVGSRIAPDTQVANTVTSSFFSESLNTPLTATNSVSSTVKAPDLSIVKRRLGPLTPGQNASYTLEVTNVGNASIRGTQTTVTDTLPPSLTPVSASGPGWNCSTSGQTITCTRSDNLAAGASFPAINLTVAVDSGASGTINNVASVANPADANPANDSSLDPAPASPQSDLTITKSASPSSVNVGGQVTFTLNVSNGGPSLARNVSVLDSLPTGLDYVSASASQGSCNATISCALGNIASGGSASITVVARAASSAAGTSLRNTASVSGGQPDPTPGNNSAFADVTVAGPDLSIVKTIDDPNPSAGGAVRYTIVVANDGPSVASSVAVRDTLPAQLTAISTDRSECSVSGNDLECAFASLAAGSSETIHVDATVSPSATPGALDNTASVSAAEFDPDPSDNSSTAKASVGSSADLSLTKSASVPAAGAGDQVTYTLTVKNDGPSDAQAVELTDELPAGVSFVSASPGCSHASGTVTCAAGSLAAGASASRTITVEVEPSAVGTLTNRARADAATADPDPGDNEASANTQVVDQADLSLRKSVSPADAVPGDTVTYTFTVRNDGPAASHDVVLSDTIPGGVTFVDSTPGAPACEFSSGTLSCSLGTIPSGAERTVTARVMVDPISMPADHRHLMPVEKVEQHVDLEAGQARDLTLSCPSTSYVMTDATVRADNVDQGTGTLGSVETRRARSSSPSSYEFAVANNAGGRAQTKLFGVCIPSDTSVEGGHSHRVLVGDPVSVTADLDTGRSDVTVPCGPGQIAIAPGIDVGGAAARLVGSEPFGNGRRFTVEADVDATTVELSVRCMSIRLDTAAGHTHDLELREVRRTVTVPAGTTVSESAICGDLEKGIVASYDLGEGLLLAGHDPQPKSRVFKLVNPTGAPIDAVIDLLCVGDRTGGPVVTSSITNSASVTSPTPDPDVSDRVASATFGAASSPPPPAPPSGGGSLGVGTPVINGPNAKYDASAGMVAVPVACAGGECNFALSLRRIDKKGKPRGKLGVSKLTVTDGHVGFVEVKLTDRARKLVEEGKIDRVQATLSYDGPTKVRKLRLK